MNIYGAYCSMYFLGFFNVGFTAWVMVSYAFQGRRSHYSIAGNSDLLEYDSVLLGEWLQMFLLGQFAVEDEGNWILQMSGTTHTMITVLYPRGNES